MVEKFRFEKALEHLLSKWGTMHISLLRSILLSPNSELCIATLPERSVSSDTYRQEANDSERATIKVAKQRRTQDMSPEKSRTRGNTVQESHPWSAKLVKSSRGSLQTSSSKFHKLVESSRQKKNKVEVFQTVNNRFKTAIDFHSYRLACHSPYYGEQVAKNVIKFASRLQVYMESSLFDPWTPYQSLYFFMHIIPTNMSPLQYADFLRMKTLRCL